MTDIGLLECASNMEFRSKEKQITVLYLVGEDVTTSIPLEVAGAVEDPRIQLIVVAYYGEGKESGLVDIPVTSLGVKGPADLSGPRKVYKCIRQYQPDVVHVHHTISSLWGSIIGKIVGKASIVRTEHDDHRYYSMGQSVAILPSIVLSDRVICNSKDTFQNLHSWEQRIASSKYEVVYNGIDVDRIDRAASRSADFRGRLRLSKDTTLIGSVGRLIRQKNYEMLLRAVPRILEEGANVHLAILGEGTRRSYLEQVIEEEGLTEHVTLVGEVPRDDVFAFLHALDLFVMPSSWEGFCNAAVEAMAAGNPMLVSDISTLREVVGDTAVFVNPDQPSSIAEGLRRLLNAEAKELNSLGAAARERAVSRYSVRRTAERYVDNYFQALGMTD